jgi:hypothetical protein
MPQAKLLQNGRATVMTSPAWGGVDVLPAARKHRPSRPEYCAALGREFTSRVVNTAHTMSAATADYSQTPSLCKKQSCSALMSIGLDHPPMLLHARC